MNLTFLKSALSVRFCNVFFPAVFGLVDHLVTYRTLLIGQVLLDVSDKINPDNSDYEVGSVEDVQKSFKIISDSNGKNTVFVGYEVIWIG